MRPKMKFLSAIEKILFALLFHCGQNETKFCLGVGRGERAH